MAGVVTTIGVIADTHIPDRALKLNPQVLSIFERAQVSSILHAGDVISPRVLAELEKIAPVYAVRGNRDIFFLRRLPMQVRLTLNGVSIGMAHGHGTFSRYMIDKFRFARPKELERRHTQRMLQAFPDVDVIVFGHLHFPCNLWVDGKLIFNPGSPSFPIFRDRPATLGLLHLDDAGSWRGEIIRLDKKIKKRAKCPLGLSSH